MSTRLIPAQKPRPLRNWSGSARWTPGEMLRPTEETQIVAALHRARRAGATLRVIGGGHSFTPLAACDDTVMTLDGYQGLVRADATTGLVTLRAGTRLWAVADLLRPHGLALSVMGDIDRQSIAGAIQTGTHGTGARFTGFAGMVRGLRIALPTGDVVDASPEQDRELFEAARLGLGAIGVILEVTLQCVPAYRLTLRESTENIDDVQTRFLDDSAHVDHHEFFWFPGTRRATVRTSQRVEQATARQRQHRAVEALQREVLANGVFEVCCRAAALVPPLSGPVAEIASRAFAGPSMTDDSHRVYAAPRRVRFHESEWAIPAEHFEEAFDALRRRFIDEGVRVTFPLEIRRVSADDVWMSTASGRDSVYIAAHRHHLERSAPYLLMVQRTLEPFEARPHWGKMHWLGARELRRLYPRFDDFIAVRRRTDSDGVLLTPYMRHLLGKSGA